MNVYLDIIFLENLILNCIILCAVGVVLKLKIKILNIALSSTIGSIYAILYYYIRSYLYSNIIMKILLSIIMVYMAFKPKNIKEIIKILVFFYVISFTFGGTTLAVVYMINSSKINIKDGIIIGNYTLKTIYTSVIIAFFIVIYTFSIVKRKISKNDFKCIVNIKINRCEIKAKALVDTGNFLKEPITNLPVIIVEKNILKNKIPDEILQNTDNILGGDFSKISDKIRDEYLAKLKVIPFSSLGKENGMLLGLKADKAILEKFNERKDLHSVIIGIYNKKLSKKNEYNAIVGFESF